MSNRKSDLKPPIPCTSRFLQSSIKKFWPILAPHPCRRLLWTTPFGPNELLTLFMNGPHYFFLAQWLWQNENESRFQQQPTFRRLQAYSPGKGQLISKANSTIFTWTKKRTKIFLYFCPKIDYRFVDSSLFFSICLFKMPFWLK